ncbi:trypsin-like peptidase domain-containing protein [Rhodopila sp.]|jgi:serine protease Do|uniref:trypsin-like peptidase domain-containing protein n=1 Tax=Rhodopila sp. TaxID=2480087 RepID=UPI002B7C9DC4|nr:trypsin-like peptidase domain-containing protein [Rhodopila sp.]HVZ06859.1 trypsin-like peptidase domain-containing protein [Rhodopila sp.]
MDKQHRPWRRAALAAVLLGGTSLGGLALGTAWADSATPVNPPGAPAVTAAHELPDFTKLVSQVKPAVVSITSKMKATPAALEDNGDDDGQSQGRMPQLPFPFNQMIPNGGMPQQPGRAMEARGSGFIIDANGTIVTNNHVVKGAKSVSVTLDDGTELPAKVIGVDPRTDIAVLKVKSDKALPFIQLGNSRDVKPGEWVVAMGNPFGLGGTVTAGIVSAVSRDIGAGPYDQFIQVDAPINQGNSGGPLFTQDGKVIGMNTAIISPSGGSVGIGFAIPSNMIKTVSAQLETTGHMTRGYLGVEAQQVTAATAKALKVPENSGALLAGVSADSPAAKAGLQPGDVIQSVNGVKIANPRELAVNVASVQPGQDANLTILRDGQTKDISVKVGTMPNEQVASNDTGPQGASRGQLGVALAPLSPEARSQLDVPDGTKGAVVQRVRPGSPAEAAGLQPGDVIVGVNTEAVGSPGEAVKALKGAMSGGNKALALRIIRNGQPAFVGVTLEQNSQG